MSTSIRLSSPAAQALAEMREHLDGHPAWLETTTVSTVIEFLVEHALRGVSLTDFRAQTKRGRPPGRDLFKNARPSDHRVE